MVASLNKNIIIGNVGSNPEMKFTPSGKAVTSFRVATNSRYKDKDGQPHEETEWFTVVCWGKLAELSNQYLHKGSLVYAEGRNKTRSWEGQDGQKHYRTEIMAEKVLFLSKPTNEKTEPADPEELSPDDIPF
jgi:single-strand DNA-binding protein